MDRVILAVTWAWSADFFRKRGIMIQLSDGLLGKSSLSITPHRVVTGSARPANWMPASG